jgi:ABC-type Zn uptake system ZnuABC Zn-binding protein ZnuA
LPILLLAIACGEEPATDAPAQAAPAASGSSPAQKSATTAVSPAATPAVSGAARPAVKTGIVTTSNIVADWVQAVGRDRVDVFSLLPPNADPHTFQPGARDITRVADAGLVLSVGLSLEAGWLDDLLKNAAGDPAKIVPLGDMVDPIDFVEIFEEHGDEEPEKALGRLLIGDGERGALSVIDLESGEVAQDRFDLVERAGRIYPTKSGRFAIAVSSDANTAHLLDGGIFLEAHGDHHDLVEVPAQRLGVDLEGDRPVHLYVGGEWAAIFYDGSGDVVLVNEHELEEQGAAYVPVRFNVGPHHGAAVPLEHDLVATTIKHPDFPANPDARRPIGAEIRDMDGNVLYRAEGCPDLHGDAGNGHLAAFGCTGGVLALEAHDGEYGDVFVAAPEGSPEDFRLTSVWGYPGLDHFFALGSAVGLYLVEPEEGAMEQLIPATEELRPIQVAFSHDGEALLVVMNDGELRMYDAHDLDMLASASGFLTTPVETGFWARPHVTTAPGAVFVTDSVGDQVFQLDDHDLEVVQQWEVAGAPTKIAFVGVLGESEGHEGHGHEEKEGHDHGELDPHFWFDPLRVKQAVSSVAARLAASDPKSIQFYRDNAAAYNAELDSLHSWIEERVATLPEERRLLVTSHDSLQYFARRYDFEVVGAIFPVSTEREPTAQELAELIETIEHEGAGVVFAEKSHSDRLGRRIAEETGATLIGGLYTGSLGEPGGEAGTYLDLMRYNVDTMVEALK